MLKRKEGSTAKSQKISLETSVKRAMTKDHQSPRPMVIFVVRFERKHVTLQRECQRKGNAGLQKRGTVNKKEFPLELC